MQSRRGGNTVVWKSDETTQGNCFIYRVLVNNTGDITDENIIRRISSIWTKGMHESEIIEHPEFVTKSDDWDEILIQATLEAL